MPTPTQQTETPAVVWKRQRLSGCYIGKFESNNHDNLWAVIEKGNPNKATQSKSKWYVYVRRTAKAAEGYQVYRLSLDCGFKRLWQAQAAAAAELALWYS